MYACIVTSFENHVSDVAFLGQRIWNFGGNRLVEAHITVTHRLKKQYLFVEIGISFVVLP
jgi:hypothetical protein